jgi:cell division protein FtsQ
MKGSSDNSRAQLVRRRRQEQAKKRLAESSALARRPLAPITTRAPRASSIPRPPAPVKAKRQYQAAFSMPGIEISMPAITFTGPTVKWRVLTFLLCALLGAALYAAWNSPELRVAPADVTGNQRIASDEINAALGITGRPIFTLVPADLENRLRLTYPELASAHVALALPNRVSVNVTERTPAILWQQGGGYTWIDDSGVAFRPRGIADNVITVDAYASPPSGQAVAKDPLSPLPYLSSDLVAAIKKLAPQAPQGTSLVYDPRYGLGWTDSRGWQVFFGATPAEMDLRLEVYASLENMLGSKGISPAFINLQYPSAPYYRMNQ